MILPGALATKHRVCEYVQHKGLSDISTVNGQITGHGSDIGVVDDPIKGRAEASLEDDPGQDLDLVSG